MIGHIDPPTRSSQSLKIIRLKHKRLAVGKPLNPYDHLIIPYKRDRQMAPKLGGGQLHMSP
jgi:hypothetical protein